MAKRAPIYSRDEIAEAIVRARKGKGRQLATIIKGCPLDDLAKGLTTVGPMYDGHFDEALFLAGLQGVLGYCMGMREGRAETAQWMKDARRKARAKVADRGAEGAP